MKTIGKITLKKQYEFTQYSEYAAWTDYIVCEPQTVDLRTDGYWLCAKFDGIISHSSFPTPRTGKWQAFFQTQKFGGIGDILDSEMFSVQITDPTLSVQVVGQYSEGCGSKSGQPILALLPIKEAA